ncbi:membrane-bound alkaline phosphatase [Lucilia cuprina]|uniref:membrane-bound alkaline phosphatase n=1 Tax=Lucilia cuprina TaxID=7375 RepID=UPI001F06ED67|nr:membrane-bound alkaline phosphatase [Lucilia cuprina]
MATIKTILTLTLLMTLMGTLHGHSYEEMDEELMHPSFKEEKQGRIRLVAREGEDTNEFWLNMGKDFVRQQKQQQQNTNVAKNIIMFLGDGMGLTTLVAARNYINAEHTKLSFEEFPYTGLSKTYSVDKIVPDSATTATAYLCGVKANYGTIGVNAAIARDDCEAMKNSSNHVFSIAKWAMDEGKSAGFVTTTRVTHASPSGVYAHTADRDWESNADIEAVCGENHGLDDIAQQLIYGEVGSKLKVMMGGGKSAFVDKRLYANGWRTDGRNLLEEYQKQSPKYKLVETKEQLEALDLTQTERLLGVFNDGHLDYHLEAVANPENTQPTLEEMTKKAIEFMQQQEDNGYFLFIEGGRIDMGHHDTKARLALDETKEFSQAIALARQMTSEEDTLIVVTSDHSHTFSVAGYQDRGSDIFSLVKNADDQLPYEPLSYANGKGYYQHYDVKNSKRVNPEQVLKGQPNDVFPATVPLDSETHGGEDVGVFASGPWSHLFTGVYEQNAIPHMMAYAACVGEGLKACDTVGKN